MNSILIIGNGPSRLDYYDYINKFEGKIYASNWIFKELIDGSIKRIDAINGDWDSLQIAAIAKKEYNLNYELWAFSPGCDHIPGIIRYKDIPAKYDSNSGLRWLVKHLIDITLKKSSIDQIFIVGMDFGGKDIFVPNHDKFNKSDWVTKFRLVLHDFGSNKIHFVGKDHMPFLLGKEPADKYAKLYMMGEDHIKNDKAIWADKKSNKVLILGNGQSRLQHKGFIDAWKDEIWGCNHFFKEYNSVPRINRLFCDAKTVKEAYEFRLALKKDWLIYVQTWIDGFKDKSEVKVVSGFKGITSGATAVEQALIEGYDKILLTGFDFGGRDIYVENQKPDAFIQHFQWIMEKYNTLAITFMDAAPAWFKHNTTIKQFYYPPKEEVEPPYPDYLARITRPKNIWHTGF